MDWPFLYRGVLRLPAALRDAVGLTEAQTSITGGTALAVLSLYTGVATALSELWDLGVDDNLSIPVLSGIAIFTALKIFG